MPKIHLLTLEAPPARGGVARYVDAIRKTFPDAITICSWKHEPKGYFFMVGDILANRVPVWVQHILPIGTAAYLARRMGGPEYVIFLHGMDFDLARRSVWKRWLTRCILRSAKRVVANSQALAGEAAHFAEIDMPLVVYPCVAEKFVVAAANVPVREEKVWFMLLTVARLVERKGHLKVLEAIKDMPNVAYDIVGDGPMREQILTRIAELGLADRVHVHTEVKDEQLPEFYRTADVFVMPASKTLTDREGFGIVYLEAGLFGLPVIACNTPGVDEAVIDGVTGVLLKDTSASLAEAVRRFCVDRTLCVTLGEQGRARVLAEFTRETQFAKLRELL